MLRNARTAVKFFVYGVIIGLMFAPQSGAENRKRMLEWISSTMGDTLSTVTGGNSGSQSSQQ